MSGTTTYDSDPIRPNGFGRAERSLRPRVTMSQVVTLRAVQHTALIGAHSGRLPGALARLVEDMVSLNQGIAVGVFSRGGTNVTDLTSATPARRFGLSVTTIPPERLV